jgi:hypothetical protein
MLFSTKTISDLLYNSNQMLGIASKDDVIMAALVTARYNLSNIDTLKATWNTADTKTKEHSAAVGLQREAKIIYKRTRKESHARYMKHVLFAKRICRHDPERMERLRLDETRKKVFNQWLFQSTDFYTQVLLDEELIAKYVNFGITLEGLEAGKQGILDTNKEKENYKMAIGNVQALKVERDRALAVLDTGIKDFALVCQYALKDNPQQLEKLGIRVYSPGYKKQSKANQNDETQSQEEQPPAS